MTNSKDAEATAHRINGLTLALDDILALTVDTNPDAEQIMAVLNTLKEQSALLVDQMDPEPSAVKAVA